MSILKKYLSFENIPIYLVIAVIATVSVAFLASDDGIKNANSGSFIFRDAKNLVPEDGFEKKLNKNERFIVFYVQEQDGSRPFRITMSRLSKFAIVDFYDDDAGVYRDANMSYSFEKALYKKIAKTFSILDYRSYNNKKLEYKIKEHKNYSKKRQTNELKKKRVREKKNKKVIDDGIHYVM